MFRLIDIELHKLKNSRAGKVLIITYFVLLTSIALIAAIKFDIGPVQFHLADLLGQDDARFDLMMAIDVFEHVEDCFGFLRKLRPHGKHHVFHIPLDLSAQSVARGHPLMKKRRTVGHLHYFTRDTALALLEDAGYEVLDQQYTAGAMELPGRSWKSKAVRLPRRLLYASSPHLAVRLLGGYSLLVLAR